ncbi:MAG TPA: phosphoglucosamine mutase [Acidobacteriota bacterium]|nr:phosphoglucosamine mutase [Acidobacteriota bacterium]
MTRLFGTDGVRGIANVPPMTVEMALEIGRATAYVCRSTRRRRPGIVIGKDTRLSGSMLESALAAGICSMGADAILVGPIPTPGIAFLTQSLRADAGVVISASHNPYQDNGIKIFSRDGYKLPDAQEDEIEHLISSGRIGNIRPTAAEIGRAGTIDDAAGRYIVFCKSAFPADLSLEGMKLVLDCANGATFRIAPFVFSELGAEVTAIHCEPDGTNINDNCGSQYTADMVAKVREVGADIGLAFDGDGDRLIAVAENGAELTGDHVLAICGKMYKDRGLLANNLLVSTVMSNFGFHAALRQQDIGHAVCKVGDRYVLEMMREKGAVIGGEPSGHMIFLNHHTTGDGIISALQLLAAMRQSGKPLSELSTIMTLSPQKTINVNVSHKPPLEELTELQRVIKSVEAELADKGRVLIRYSGTQAMCRVMVEGPTEDVTTRLANLLADAVAKSIG